MFPKFIFMDEAGDGTGSGSADGGNGAGGAASLLAGGAEAGAGAPDLGWMPEKYRVNNEAGAFDLEASARKVAEGYSSLEKRFGNGEAAPKTAEEYAPKVETEGFNWDEFKADPDMQGFLKGAHARGINNDQLSYILGEHMQRAAQLAVGSKALDAEGATAELRKTWANEADFKTNLGHSFRAATSMAAKAGLSMQDIEAAGLGNNPVFVRLMAALGPELAEDVAPHNGMAIPAGFDVDAAMRSEAYTNPKHAEHEKVSKQIQAHFQRKFGNQPAI